VRALALLLACSAAWAAPSTGIVADRLVPGIGPSVMIGAEAADVTPMGMGALALGFGVVKDPLRLTLPDGSLLSRPVRWQFSSDLSAEAGLWKSRLAFAVGLPVVWWAAGDRLRGTGTDDAPLKSPRAGDLRLRVKAALLGNRRLHVAALLQVTVPLGGQKEFAATDGVTVEPRLIADVRLGRALIIGALGVRFASDRTLFRTTFGDALTWSLGVGGRVWQRRKLWLEVMGEGAGEAGGSSGTRPVELRGAVRFGAWPVSVDLGAGAGVDGDAGAPAWRVFAVVRALVGRPR
jgi:hypothetical protein